MALRPPNCHLTSAGCRSAWRLPVLLLGLAAVGACRSELAGAGDTQRTTPWLEGGAIRLPSGFVEREGIAFAPVTQQALTPELKVTGIVTYDARRVAAVGGRIEGRVRAIRHVKGEDVRDGDVVVELESVELGKAQAAVLKARAREKVARVDADRERLLAQSKVTALREAQYAAANAEALTTERIAAEKAVEALGGSLNGELGVLRLRSPLAGRIVEMKIMRGQTVQAAETLFVVADLSRLWVELQVFERDIPLLREQDVVDIRVPSDPSRVYRSKISYVAEAVDAKSRAGEARVELDRPAGLRPGLSVTATIRASGTRGAYLAVKREAITRIDGKPTIFVKTGTAKVQPRHVVLGAEDSTHVSILDGVAAGDQVAISGVLALKAEVFR